MFDVNQLTDNLANNEDLDKCQGLHCVNSIKFMLSHLRFIQLVL